MEVKNTKAYEVVIDSIKDMVFKRELRKGDKLPTERELAESLKVSRTSVREAIRSLEIIGLVESKQGAGNYIKDDFATSLFEPLSVMFMLQESSPKDIFQLREVLELECCRLAAKNIRDYEMDRLLSIISEMKETDSEERSSILDKEFHNLITTTSRNKLIINVLNVVSKLIEISIKEYRSQIIDLFKNDRKLVEIHESIYLALRSRDEEKIIKAMEEHYTLIKQSVKM
ncbi:FadR/GntR family transcriptional regulator [Clostridium sp. 'White wine YQ']|uniref:FadR/GntR family transcriptional regulator n=1 Tax=Clostridium sp. 'White wine YQ' TaxID=3027474 RepID=UPI002366FAD3|nr:FadR/GntR family transcriptional regulator [Clostridium sp. 'White wine YQ']MDD7792720.1 FadR/GntR family transcriptional regulator [Clostridium sp. 'White wine YQ']